MLVCALYQVTALNAIYGVEAWNFGSRTIKGRTGNRNRALDRTNSQVKAEPAVATAVADDNAPALALPAEAAAAVDLTEALMASPIRRVPSKKGGPRKGGVGAKATKKPGAVQICRDCNQVGQLSKIGSTCHLTLRLASPLLKFPNYASARVMCIRM